MDAQKKLDFVLKMTKHALAAIPHYDSGGTVLQGPVQAGNTGADTKTGGLYGALSAQNNFQASSANINPGTTTGQLNQAYQGAQGALNNAGALNSQVQPGVATGVNAQGYLAHQLENQIEGGGPQPALNQLNQNTRQNINQAAALAGSVRGAGYNPGLVASNIAQNYSNAEQQAIGQAATLQAQQQLAEQQQLQGLAGTQVNQGLDTTQLVNQAQQNEQNILQGANTAANNQQVAMQSNINNANAAVSAANAQAANQQGGGLFGGILGGIGSFIGGLFAEGGEVPEHIKEMAKIYHPHLYSGGPAYQFSTPVSAAPIDIGSVPNLSAPNSSGSSAMNGAAAASGPAYQMAQKIKGALSNPQGDAGTNPTGVGGQYGLGGQGMVDQLGASPYLAPTSADSLAMPQFGSALDAGAAVVPTLMSKGGDVKDKLKKGGKVPGKPKVNHDSYSNDTVTAKLSPGEVVIDLNTMKDKGKLGQMARFVAKEIERKKAGRKLA